MSDFDPDAYLAKKTAAPGTAFDPDAYLKKKEPGIQPAPEQKEFTAGNYLRSIAGGIERQLASPKDALGMAVRTFGHGASLGMTDELSGLMGVSDELGRRERTALGIKGESSTPTVDPEKPLLSALLDRYRLERDSTREDLQKGRDEFPIGAPATEFLGTLSIPLPGPGKAKAGSSLLAALGKGAATGAALGGGMAAGNSEADLTKGELGKFGGEVLEGAMLGAPFGALGGGLGLRYANKAQTAANDAVAAQQKLADKAFASARGSFGAEASGGNRQLELLREILQNPQATAEQKAKAAAFLQSDEGLALVRGVYEGALTRSPDALSRVEAAKAGMLDAAANQAPDAVQSAADDFLNKSTLIEDVFPRAKKYAARALPQYISRLFGGGDSGQVAATVVGAQLGDPGTALANMLRNARFRHSSANTLGTVAPQAAKLGAAEAKAVADWLRGQKSE